LWDAPSTALDTIVDTLALVDLVKVSSDLMELSFLTGTSDPADACRVLRQHGPAMAIVTLGGGGCYFQSARLSGEVPGVAVEVVDTLGAGDAFVAGLLAGLSAHPDDVVLHDEDALVRALRFANAVGAITTTRFGAIPALPTRAEVENRLGNRRY
jgi:fructokinase